MTEVLTKITEYTPMVLQGLGALVLAGTVIVRLTPTPNDDKIMGKIEEVWGKVTGWLPTLGINPQTQKLKEALSKLKS